MGILHSLYNFSHAEIEVILLHKQNVLPKRHAKWEYVCFSQMLKGRLKVKIEHTVPIATSTSVWAPVTS